MRKYLQKGLVLLLVLLLATVGLMSCATKNENNAPQSNAAIQFIDDDGRNIALDSPCQRIISLYSAHTENLFTLGAGDLIIGVHDTSIYPPET
ncbi:MAG: hypothetical protein PHN47_05025, partial [Clostridia bacterium]|nr:hypothetical protein [Clostridia bacterium]